MIPTSQVYKIVKEIAQGESSPHTWHISSLLLCSIASESCSVLSDSLRPCGLYSPWNSPGQNTGVGCHFFLQQIFPTQESNRDLLHCRRILYQLSYQGSPMLCWEPTKHTFTVHLVVIKSGGAVRSCEEGVKCKSSLIICFSFIPDVGDLEPGTKGGVCERCKCFVSHVPIFEMDVNRNSLRGSAPSDGVAAGNTH